MLVVFVPAYSAMSLNSIRESYDSNSYEEEEILTTEKLRTRISTWNSWTKRYAGMAYKPSKKTGIYVNICSYMLLCDVI